MTKSRRRKRPLQYRLKGITLVFLLLLFLLPLPGSAPALAPLSLIDWPDVFEEQETVFLITTQPLPADRAAATTGVMTEFVGPSAFPVLAPFYLSLEWQHLDLILNPDGSMSWIQNNQGNLIPGRFLASAKPTDPSSSSWVPHTAGAFSGSGKKPVLSPSRDTSSEDKTPGFRPGGSHRRDSRHVKPEYVEPGIMRPPSDQATDTESQPADDSIPDPSAPPDGNEVPVPEPASFVLMLSGLLGISIWRVRLLTERT